MEPFFSAYLLFYTACFECSSTPLFLSLPASHFVTSACLECAMRKGDLTNRSKAAVRVSAGGRAPNKTFSSLGPTLTYAAQIDRRRPRPEPLFSIAQSNPIPSRWPTAAAADYSCHLACHLILAHPAVRHPPHSLPPSPSSPAAQPSG